MLLNRRPLLVISLAQLLGTSLWFSANAVTIDLMRQWSAPVEQIGWLTSAVQAGFILGTLVISITGLADKFPASKIFVTGVVLGAIMNIAFALLSFNILIGIAFRFLVGVCLAGVYPMGMKMIVKWAPEKASWGLSLLVGMLTIGTALPHGMKAFAASLPWQAVIACSSILALAGGVLILKLRDGPSAGKASQIVPGLRAVDGLRLAFSRQEFRKAAIGYFGHMWELYAFWTVVPMFIAEVVTTNADTVSVLSFTTIAVGALGCIIGGLASRRFSSITIAATALLISAACCIIFALGWNCMPPSVALAVLGIWGMAVIADSPQFSALSAQSCPPEFVGSALALQNAVGFAVTMASILFATQSFGAFGSTSAVVLAIGPIIGLLAMFPPSKWRTR